MENNETIVVVKRKKAFLAFAVKMKVWVDGNEAAKSIKNGQEVQITVPNGEHTIMAGTTGIDKGAELSFTAAGETISFLAEPQIGKVSAGFKLTQLFDTQTNEQKS